MRLIDADALLNDSSIVYHTEFGDAVVDVEDIKKAPTIKTFTLADIEEQYRKGLEKGLEERPHGEAIYKKLDGESGVTNSYWCSHCGFPIVQVYMSFCGHCGAEIESKVKQMETEEGEAE